MNHDNHGSKALLNNDFAIVILAGGRAERLGEPKGLVSVLGQPWLKWQHSVVSALTTIPPIVVVGFHKDAYELALTNPTCWDVVHNATPEFGPFSSLQVGVAHALKAHPNLKGVFVLPVDTAAPIAAVWLALAEKIATGKFEAAIPTRTNINGATWERIEVRPARSGHPVCLSKALCHKILALDKSSSTTRLDYVFAELKECEKSYVEVEDCRPFINMNTKFEWCLFAPVLVPNLHSPLIAKQRLRASIVCVHNNSLLMISAREPHSGIVMNFAPGGAIEHGETPAQAAVRETMEETGLPVEVYSTAADAAAELIARYYFPWKGLMYDATTHFIAARLLPNGQRPFAPDDAAIEAIEWVPLSLLQEKLSFFAPQSQAIQKLVSVSVNTIRP